MRIAECWGLSHQHKYFGVPCLDRSALSCTGMMTSNVVDLLGTELTHDVSTKDGTSMWYDVFFDKEEEDAKGEMIPTPIDHEYVSLPFSGKVLDALKAHGMKSCILNSKNVAGSPLFVSKNDMIMASTWILKRFLSKTDNSHLSIVMNLRGRCGVNNFHNDTSHEARNGLFGNGIVNVFAEIKPSLIENNGIGLVEVSTAARAIRKSLIEGMDEIPSRLGQSKIGRPVSSMTKPSTSNTSTYFSTTSWRQLSPQHVSFAPSSTLVSFHGQPAHPLPLGRTYNSIVHADLDNFGSTVSLFLPSDQAKTAVRLHGDLCKLFLEWHDASDEDKLG